MRILKINSLPNTKQWVDKDHIMLHACFQLLCDAIEKEEILLQFNTAQYRKIYDEITFLYNWWNNRKNLTFDDDKEDDLMLIRLLKVRLFLWT